MYYSIKLLRKILMRLPLSWVFFVGRIVGEILYFNKKKRATTFKNIKMVFPYKKSCQIRKIVKASFKNLGLSIIEILIAPRLVNYVTINGKEQLGKDGGVIVGVHEGNWELYHYCFAKKYRLALFVKEQKNKSLNRLLNEIRRESGSKVCSSLKEVMYAMKQNHFSMFAIDHGAEKNAPILEFFSHLIPTPAGAVHLAKKFNRKIYPCCTYRKGFFTHVVEVVPPIEVSGRDEKDILRELNKIYEKHLEEYPLGYIWQYKRFKRKQDIRVVILNDGKTGHFKQSQAFVSFLREGDYKISSKIINVKYKNKLAKLFSLTCAWLATPKGCIGHDWCLRLVLDKNTCSELEVIYADIVVSTGSLCAPVNKIFASFLGAKSVVILKPNLPLEKFDLSIVPWHDRVQAKNAVKIKGALFYPFNLENKMANCKDTFTLSGDKKVSLFLGGPLRNEKEFVNNTKVFIERLKDFSQQKGYKLLVSTSRRTPAKIEGYLEKELASFGNTEKIIYASRANYDFVFEGFVLLSEIVFVSSESISMISEILSLGKPCVVVELEKQSDKHSYFLDSIKQDISFLGYPYTIENIHLKISSVFEENRHAVKQAIKRIL